MGFIGWAVLLICLFLGATLFFSVNATTLRTFSRVRLQEAFKKQNRSNADALIDRIAENAERLTLTCALFRLILNMCALLLLVAVVTTARGRVPTFADYALIFVIATVVFSVFIVAIPHAWAKYAGEQTLSRTYPLLALLAMLASPALFVMRWYDLFVRRLAGVTDTSVDQQAEEKQEEFLEDLEQHRMEGTVDEEEQQMIENVLELSETTVDEIMTPRTDVVAIDATADLQTVLDTVTDAGHSRLPVYEGTVDRIVGLIYAKDLLGEIGKEPADFSVRDKMRQAYFVPETKSLRELLHEFQNQKLHIAVVLDEYGGTAGIVTLEDILEELVGEIVDEYEQAAGESIVKVDQDTVEVDARTYVDDLNDTLEVNLPEDEDYDTVGGFVCSQLGYIPKAGETLDYGNLKFTIASAEARRIKRVRIQKVGGQQPC